MIIVWHLTWFVWNKIDYFTIRVECCNFLNLYGRYVLQHELFFYNFLLIDATDRSKISSDQKRVFSAVSLFPLSFFANTPFNIKDLDLIGSVVFSLWTQTDKTDKYLLCLSNRFSSDPFRNYQRFKILI